jgi:hypothetical protein
MGDPLPGKVMVTITEVRQLFGLTDPAEFDKFVAEQPLFPRPVRLGKTANGKPRLRDVKCKVFAFIDLWAAAGSDYGDTAPDAASEEAEEEQHPRIRARQAPG